ncbi:protein bassoon [Limosa lapponica baueri]|uniref:Protein bassoon n=1 Tax=Limosa lapponica baueri TaxID=1758121 RepID=A0A2I0TPQ9_LIMLA|nr:protein bassoon [Limosa lapponica baueri]
MEELHRSSCSEYSPSIDSEAESFEDASPTEELRQAAEMEELHRSSCSEYSPSIDSEAESFDAVASKLYKSGSEYNLPTFMSLYSPTEKGETGPSQPTSKPLKSAEEAYEEMMRKAEMMQKQQVQQAQPAVSYGSTYQQVGYRGTEGQNGFEYQYTEEYRYDGGPTRPSQPGYPSALPKAGAVYEEILQTSQSISRMHQSSSFDLALEQGEKAKGQEEAYQEKHFLNAESAYADLMKQNGGPLTPGTSPTQLSAPVSFATSEGSAGKAIPDVRVTQHFAKEGQDLAKLQSAPAAPSPASKAATTPYTYGKGAGTVTTASGTPGIASRSYSSPAPEAPSIASRSYSPAKSTVSYGSQTEDTSRSKTVVEISVQTAREKLPAASDSKPSPPKMYPFFKSSSPPLSPTSPTQSPTRAAKATAEFSTQTQSPLLPYEAPTAAAAGPAASSPMVAQGTQTPHRAGSPRLTRQPSSQDSTFMVITLAADAASQTKPPSSDSSASPTSSPTRTSRQLPVHGYSQEPEQPPGTYVRAQPVKEHTPKAPAVTSAADGITGLYGWGALPAENISLCRISSIPGTSRVEPGPKVPSTNAVDLRTALKSAPIIITDQGMDLTSLATEARKYCLTLDHIPSRQSTAIQPLIINLNAQEQPHAIIAAASTASLAIASPMILSQPKQPVVYGDPFQSRVDFGQGTGSPVCLAQVKQVEQGIQTATVRASGAGGGKPEPPAPSQTKFARYGVPGQMVKKDMLITQTGGAQNVGGIQQPFPPEPGSEMYRAVPVELKSQSPLLALGGKKSQPTCWTSRAAAAPKPPPDGAQREEREREEERQRKQQEHVLQLERERVELEKLRQLRLQEELERERAELQRHREKEQLLVQRELQELQCIKQQVLQQQQEERHAQLALQREQLAQQRLQLEHIHQLQHQLQQQLEEQKRQKTAFPEPAARPPEGPVEVPRGPPHNGQAWPPPGQAQPEGPAGPRYPTPQRPLSSSASDMSLQAEESWEPGRGIKKRNSMPRLRDAYEKEGAREAFAARKTADSSVQTDEEDGEERYLLSRRRRTRRSADCSVQTDEEDSGEWEQPVRRRRSRPSRHAEAGAEGKPEGTTRGTASVGIQTISDCSVQTEPDQLLRVSPSIHITTHDPRVEIVKYISAPEKTQRGESLACQTEPEPAPQPGVVVPQLTVPTTIPPYSTNIQMVSTGPLDPHTVRQQTLGKFEKKKPDPLEIGYQSHLPAESLSQLVTRQPPRSPQVLYSPVSPLSPHRLLESSFATSERLNKAHVPPQKHFTAESAQRQQTLPRPIKTMQRSLSDPKPISPTAEETGKDRFSLYQHPLLPSTQVGGLQSSPLARKVKRTLPSPPPEEPHVPLASPATSQLYLSSLATKATAPVTKASLLKELDRDLKLVEHEATKLRKKQAELDEEEKEIDAKLKYLELGITQRKESLLKERGGGRDHPYLRCPGDRRDYLSDSELHSLRLAAYDSAGLRPAPTGQYPDFAATAASYGAYPYPAPQAPAAFPPARLQHPQFPTASTSQDGLPAAPLPTFASPGTFPAPGPAYPELGAPGQPGFRPQNPYQAPSAFAGAAAVPATQPALFQSLAEVAGGHQKPRQTSLADLEQKIPTNYEVIGAATSSSAVPDATFSTTTASGGYEQYKAPEARPAERAGAAQGPSASFSSESLYTSLEQNIPRNYVMIEDISELTKESPAVEGQKAEAAGTGADSRHGREKSELGDTEGSSRPCCYAKAEEESEEDIYDHHGPDHRGKNSYHRGVESNGRVLGSSASSSYYYGDSEYRHSSRADKHGSGVALPKHSSKNLAPAVVSSKRSKHRKQGMEQKISKFSPIEEAKDVESDLASYAVTTSVGGSNVASRAKKLQEEITYGLKKNVYEQQKYYGVSSRDLVDEEDRVYSGGSRTRSSGYGVEKSSVRESGGRSKSYEREGMERSQKGGSKPSSLSMRESRGRAPVRAQPSEEESPVSPLGKSVGGSRATGGPGPQSAGDPCSQFCSSHSLPDVQEHIKDVPRSHSYKHEEGYGMDDAHCVVSDSEAYHLGQEETDWFDKPREARAERVRHYGGHSSSQKRPPVKHTYHDYDEPPDEDPWQHDDYPQHREHRHHGEYGRHTGTSRHASDEPPRRSTKQHPREPSRHEPRGHGPPATSKKAQQPESRGPASYGPSSSDGVGFWQEVHFVLVRERHKVLSCTDEVVEVYRELSRHPGLKAACLGPDVTTQYGGKYCSLYTEWSQQDLARAENVKFCRQYLIFHDGTSVVYSGPAGTCSEIKDELLSRESPSGALKAVLRKVSSKDKKEEKQFLEVWDQNCKVKSIDLAALDKHGTVYDDDHFGCLAWTHSETHLLYVAEKKRPKAESFFQSKPPELDASNEDVGCPEKADVPLKGEQFVYHEDWGEALSKRSVPVLCVMDIEDGSISVLEDVPEHLSPGQAFWSPNDTGVVFVGWWSEPFRLGLQHCTNRR